jgi:hypothetical protein
VDVLDGPESTSRIARSMPRFGVTAFCPTTVACSPVALGGARRHRPAAQDHGQPGEARVLPAHLETLINHDAAAPSRPSVCACAEAAARRNGDSRPAGDFRGADVLLEIERPRRMSGSSHSRPNWIVRCSSFNISCVPAEGVARPFRRDEQSHAAIRMGAYATHLLIGCLLSAIASRGWRGRADKRRSCRRISRQGSLHPATCE